MNSDYKRYIEKKADICMSADSFSPDLYEKYDVKKGLRDSKGNGVVVGLTTVSEVNGTIKVDGVKVPCEGRLKYRGYDIRDLCDPSPPRRSWRSSSTTWPSRGGCRSTSSGTW